MKLFVFLRTIVTYLLIGLLGVFFVLPCLIISLLPASCRYDNRLYFWFSNLFYKLINFATFLPITIEGREHLKDIPSIVIANHESTLDVPILGSLFGGYPHVWMFLSRFAKIPILGFILRRMNIVVNFSGLQTMMRSLREASALLKTINSHLVLFPEGGRENKIAHFYVGFAYMAKITGRPVVPVMMYNLGKAYPPHSFLIHIYPIRVIIGKPFYYKEGETEKEFVKRVRQWFIQKEQQATE